MILKREKKMENLNHIEDFTDDNRCSYFFSHNEMNNKAKMNPFPDVYTNLHPL